MTNQKLETLLFLLCIVYNYVSVNISLEKQKFDISQV